MNITNEKKEKIISEHLLPEDEKIIFSSCDFHLGEEDKNFMSSSIPLTLKDKNFDKEGKYFILFYYDTDEQILKKWIDVSRSLPVPPVPPAPPAPPAYTLRCVNLDYQKKLRDTFINLTISNPFKWMKIKEENKSSFIIFYENTLPQEFYRDKIDIPRLDNFVGEINSRTVENIKSKKTKTFESLNFKEGYYKALEDGYPIPGIKKGYYYRVIDTGGKKYKFLEVTSS